MKKIEKCDVVDRKFFDVTLKVNMSEKEATDFFLYIQDDKDFHFELKEGEDPDLLRRVVEFFEDIEKNKKGKTK